MKKLLSFLMISVFALAMVGCGENTNANDVQKSEAKTPPGVKGGSGEGGKTEVPEL